MAKKNYSMLAKNEKLRQQRISYNRERRDIANYIEDMIERLNESDVAQLVNDYCWREIKKAQAFKACNI